MRKTSFHWFLPSKDMFVLQFGTKHLEGTDKTTNLLNSEQEPHAFDISSSSTVVLPLAIKYHSLSPALRSYASGLDEQPPVNQKPLAPSGEGVEMPVMEQHVPWSKAPPRARRCQEARASNVRSSWWPFHHGRASCAPPMDRQGERHLPSLLEVTCNI